MKVRRQRGSICLYVAVILLCLGMLTAATIPLATGFRSRSARRADEFRARLAFEAGVAKLKSQSLAMTLVLPATLSIATNGITGTLTATANDSKLVNSLLITGTIVRNGQSYRYSRVIGMRQPQPFDFVLCTQSTLEVKQPSTLGTTGTGGDLWSTEGDVKISTASTTVNGNLIAKGTADSDSKANLTGRRISGQAQPTWPSLDAAGYKTEAINAGLLGIGTVNYLPTTLPAITFASPSNGTYAAIYCDSDLNLSGPIIGKGTIFVKGNLTISGDLSYANGTSEAAIVVKGNVTISGASNVVGYLFCGGTVTVNKDLTMTRGAIVASSLSCDKKLTLTRDDAILLDTAEATRLRLPYYWP